jgi:hypothetical protein
MIGLFTCLKRRIKEVIDLLSGKKYPESQSTAVDFKEVFLLLKPFDIGIDLIRVGGSNDGGYLVPNDLVGVEMCLSPGYGYNSSFEEHLLSKNKIKSTVFDLLPKSKNFPEFFTYVQKYISFEDNFKSITLDTAVKNLNKSITGDLILQMDIEGSEFLSLLATPQHIIDRFRIMVIELHYLERVRNKFWAEQIIFPFLRKITLNHTICHTHPNNAVNFFDYKGIQFPRALEITLLRNDRIKSKTQKSKIIPHAQDASNKPALPELLFDFSALNELQ